MSTKEIKGVIIPRHDTAINWSKAVNFKPKQGELVVFDKDIEDDISRGYYLDAEGNRLDSLIINGETIELIPSDKVRFKFGDGINNVNVLPFVTTGHNNEDIDIEDYVTEDWVKDYIDKNYEAAAMVYLSTQEQIGKYLELPDVYPVQADNPMLGIMSKNMINIPTDEKIFDSVSVKLNEDCFTVSGSSEEMKNITLHNEFLNELNVDKCGIKIKTPGKYTINIIDKDYDYFSDEVIDITFNVKLFREGKAVLDRVLDMPYGQFNWTIDSRELDFDTILLYVCFSNTTNVDNRRYQIQVEPGDKFTSYSSYRNDFNGKRIESYNKNIFNIDKLSSSNLPTVKKGYTVKFGNSERTISTSGAYYLNGIVQNAAAGESFIVLDDSNNEIYSATYDTPFHDGDRYTFSFVEVNSEEETEMANVQILFGHVSESTYESPVLNSCAVDSNGTGDDTIIQFPYCFLAINDTEDAYRLYVKFDPALTRDWTEEQLNKINNSIAHNPPLLNGFDLTTITPGAYIWKGNTRMMYSQPQDDGSKSVVITDYMVNANTPITIINYPSSTDIHRVVYISGKVSNKYGVNQDIDCIELKTSNQSGEVQYTLTTYKSATQAYVDSAINQSSQSILNELSNLSSDVNLNTVQREKNNVVLFDSADSSTIPYGETLQTPITVPNLAVYTLVDVRVGSSNCLCRLYKSTTDNTVSVRGIGNGMLSNSGNIIIASVNLKGTILGNDMIIQSNKSSEIVLWSTDTSPAEGPVLKIIGIM